jgi:hypothetical protein
MMMVLKTRYQVLPLPRFETIVDEVVRGLIKARKWNQFDELRGSGSFFLKQNTTHFIHY